MDKVTFKRTETFTYEFNEEEFPELYDEGVLNKDKVLEKLKEGIIFGESIYDIALEYNKESELV